MREKAEKDLKIKKEENNIKRIQEKRLRVSLQNKFQLLGQVVNDPREQMQKVATAAESAHYGTVASTTAIAKNLYGYVLEIK